MTPRFDENNAAPAPKPDSELPLLTVGWRAIRDHHERLHCQRQLAEEESRRTKSALVELAEDLHRLLSYVSAAREPMCAETLKNLTGRLERSLQTVGIEVLAPVGLVGILLGLALCLGGLILAAVEAARARRPDDPGRKRPR